MKHKWRFIVHLHELYIFFSLWTKKNKDLISFSKVLLTLDPNNNKLLMHFVSIFMIYTHYEMIVIFYKKVFNEILHILI